MSLPDLGIEGIEVRPAGGADADLIRRVLALAASWRETEPPAGLPPAVAGYHEGWKRPDDLGVLAFLGPEFVGGAYCRRVGPADGTYGWIADDLAELTIGVEAGHRGRGIGQLLLISLQGRVRQGGRAGMSLSVELDNPARRLYATVGFVEHEVRETDVLMAWRPVNRSA